MMKKSPFLLLKLSLLLAFGSPQAQAGTLDDFLGNIEKEFERALTPAKQYKIVSRPINLEYLKGLKNIQDLKKEELSKGVSSHPTECTDGQGRNTVNYRKTTPFSLAVSMSKVNLVRKFLPVIPNVNAPELTSWGDRQPYTPAHLALHTQYPKNSQASVEDRLEIIDLLGKQGADFNAIVKGGGYLNPPLAAGEPMGCPLSTMTPLRALALLYGADPAVKGSCWNGLKLEYEEPLGNLTLEYYIERVKAGITLRPIVAVKSWLEGLAAKKGINLDKLRQNIEEKRSKLNRLEMVLQNNQKVLEKFKSQNTKKAKRRQDHYETLIRHNQEKVQTLTRTLRR